MRLVREDGKVYLEEQEEDVKGKRVVTNLASYAMLGYVVWKETRCHGRRYISFSRILRPRGARVLDEAFDRDTARLLAEWRTAHQKGSDDAVPDDMRSFEQRLRGAWEAECADVAKYMNSTKRGFYGDGISSPGRACRYAFWPLYAKRWPLHFWCACILLIIPWGNTHIERVNSGAGLINTKLRGRMTPDTLQRMALLRVWLRIAIARIEAAWPRSWSSTWRRCAPRSCGGGHGGGVRGVAPYGWSASFVR